MHSSEDKSGTLPAVSACAFSYRAASDSQHRDNTLNLYWPMDTKDFEAVVCTIEHENDETRKINTELRELIEDTQKINQILEENIKNEISKDIKSPFIRDMLS